MAPASQSRADDTRRGERPADRAPHHAHRRSVRPPEHRHRAVRVSTAFPQAAFAAGHWAKRARRAAFGRTDLGAAMGRTAQGPAVWPHPWPLTAGEWNRPYGCERARW